jgi:hypothetical protein
MFTYAARGDMPPVKVFTYDNAGQKPQLLRNLEKEFGLLPKNGTAAAGGTGRGRRRPRQARSPFDTGTVYVGDKGYLYTDTYGGGLRLFPESRRKDFPEPGKSLTRAHGGPIEDLFWAIKNDGVPCSNFADYSGRFTEMILTGQLAMFAGPGKKVRWDVAAMRCTNLDDLNQFVHRSYRKGWEV